MAGPEFSLLKYSISFADQSQMSYDGSDLSKSGFIKFMPSSIAETADIDYYVGHYGSSAGAYYSVEGLDFGGDVGTAVGDGVLQMISKGSKKEKIPSQAKRGEQLMVININTGEITNAGEDVWEMMMEGCKEFLALDKKTQKAMIKSGDRDAVTYLNKCYSK